MNYRLAVPLVVLQFASFLACAQELMAPSDSTVGTRAKDMGRCLAVAQGHMSRQESYSFLSIMDDLKPYVLKGKDSGGYIYTTLLSGRASPVVDKDGFPTRRESLLGTPSSDKTSDRYIMCLLSSGYRWKDSTQSYIDLIRELADSGVAPAQAELAMLYTSNRSGTGRLDFNEFVNLTRKAAEQGYGAAQFNLSYAYGRGDGVARDEEQALQWMALAAKGGYSRAMPILERQERLRAELQSRRLDVVGLEADRLAADAGDLKAQFRLAARFEDGRGVDRSMAKAIEWYRKAGDNGSAEAQQYLGVIFDKGRGVKQDNAEAISWYKKAAEQGQGQAQYNLGVFYFYGRGVAVDRDEAKKWFERARESGFEAASGTLKDFY